MTDHLSSTGPTSGPRRRTLLRGGLSAAATLGLASQTTGAFAGIAAGAAATGAAAAPVGTYSASGTAILLGGSRVATAVSVGVAGTLAHGLNAPFTGSAYRVVGGTGVYRVSQSRTVAQASSAVTAATLVARLNANRSVVTPSASIAPLVVPAVNGSGARLATVGAPDSRLALTGVAVWGIKDFVAGSFAQGQYDNRDQVCATIASWGANHIRLRVLADEYDHLRNMGSRATYLTWVKNWVAAAKAHGLYVYLCWWDSLDSSDGSRSNANWATQYGYAFPMMTDVHNALKLTDGSDDPAIFYEPFNEPNHVNWAQWLTAMRATVARWRLTNGYQGVLVIDTTTWSHDYSDSYMSQLEFYDATLTKSGRHNLVFSRHDYCNDYRNFSFNGGTWVAATGGEATAHVLLETEFGNYNGAGNTSSGWSKSIASYFHTSGFARANIAGMTAFLFGNWYDANGMSHDAAGASRTAWGDDVRAFLPQI